MTAALAHYPRTRPVFARDPSPEDLVRIKVGMHRDMVGEVTDITGGVCTVRFAGGSATYRVRDLEVVR